MSGTSQVHEDPDKVKTGAYLFTVAILFKMHDSGFQSSGQEVKLLAGPMVCMGVGFPSVWASTPGGLTVSPDLGKNSTE